MGVLLQGRLDRGERGPFGVQLLILIHGLHEGYVRGIAPLGAARPAFALNHPQTGFAESPSVYTGGACSCHDALPSYWPSKRAVITLMAGLYAVGELRLYQGKPLLITGQFPYF